MQPKPWPKSLGCHDAKPTAISRMRRKWTDLPWVQPSVPITLKMPEDVVKRLRSHAQASGMAIGEIVAHAVASFLDKLHRHG